MIGVRVVQGSTFTLGPIGLTVAVNSHPAHSLRMPSSTMLHVQHLEI